jgi:hypothetical protein
LQDNPNPANELRSGFGTRSEVEPIVHLLWSKFNRIRRRRNQAMRKRRIAICLILWLLAGAVPVLADTIINIDSNGNGISLTHQSGGGQYISFSNLAVSAVGDSANNTSLVISSGAGHFFFNSVSSDGLTGFFASNQSSGIITIGNTSSGILTGTLQLVEIDTTTTHAKPNGYGAFTITLTLSNLAFTACSVQNCNNSEILQAFAAPGAAQNSTDTLSFSFASTTAQNARALENLSGTHPTTASGMLDSYVDTVAPEPASLALFGSGFLLAGMKLLAKFKHTQERSTT